MKTGTYKYSERIIKYIVHTYNARATLVINTPLKTGVTSVGELALVKDRVGIKLK